MEDSKSITKGCCILAALVLTTFNLTAARVAPAALTCQSLFAGPSTPEHGVRQLYSTPDVPLGLPQHTVGTGGNLIMNGEIRPTTNRIVVSGTNVVEYEMDAAVIPASVDVSQVRSTDVLFGGKLHFHFPTNDVDTNGVLDFLQFEKGANVYLTGAGITEYSTNGQRYQTTVPVDGEGHPWAWADGAGLVGGLAYHWDIIEVDAAPGLDTSGILEPLYMNGSVTNRGNTVLVFGLRSTDPSGRTNAFGAFSYKGTAPARVRGDELRIGKFNLRRNDGVKIRVNKTTLRRVNGEYVGKITFNDWNPETPWADYTEWAIEIGEFVRR